MNNKKTKKCELNECDNMVQLFQGKYARGCCRDHSIQANTAAFNTKFGAILSEADDGYISCDSDSTDEFNDTRHLEERHVLNQLLGITNSASMVIEQLIITFEHLEIKINHTHSPEALTSLKQIIYNRMCNIYIGSDDGSQFYLHVIRIHNLMKIVKLFDAKYELLPPLSENKYDDYDAIWDRIKSLNQ
jgi:hypothetical protein